MSTTTVPEKRWPRDYRETAYELYASAAEQSVTRVAELLSALKRETVPVSTVHRWKDADRWEERYKAESPASALYLRNLHMRELLVAAPEAIAYLQRVVTGEEPGDARRVQAAITLETAARSLLLKAPDQRQKPRPVTRSTSLPQDPDELYRLEAERREARARNQ
jgi:hypothetical protein